MRSLYSSFAEVLDGFLEGLWRKYDYELHNARTIVVGYPENKLIVYFGDKNTRASHMPRMRLSYEREDIGLKIVDIEVLNETSLAYSVEVLDFLQDYVVVPDVIPVTPVEKVKTPDEEFVGYFNKFRKDNDLDWKESIKMLQKALEEVGDELGCPITIYYKGK